MLFSEIPLRMGIAFWGNVFGWVADVETLRRLVWAELLLQALGWNLLWERERGKGNCMGR